MNLTKSHCCDFWRKSFPQTLQQMVTTQLHTMQTGWWCLALHSRNYILPVFFTCPLYQHVVSDEHGLVTNMFFILQVLKVSIWENAWYITLLRYHVCDFCRWVIYCKSRKVNKNVKSNITTTNYQPSVLRIRTCWKPVTNPLVAVRFCFI